MARTYTSTIEVNCRKEHTCAGCGAAYSYPFVRKVKGQGNTAERATANCQKNVAKTVAESVDLYPCPTCGLYQPDMIGQQRRSRHNLVMWLGILLLFVLIMIRFWYGMQSYTASICIAAVCAAIFAGHLLVEFWNPNRDLMGNTQRSANMMAQGILTHTPGRVAAPTDEWVNPFKSTLHRMALPLILVAAGMAYSPELMRTAFHWPLNPDCYPPVVGPQDTTRVYMQQSISSIKGYWRGEVKATLLPLDTPQARPIPITGTTNQNSWSGTIEVKSSEKSDSSTPWVELTMPVDNLAGKTVQCAIKLHLQYPQDQGNSKYRTISSTMVRTLNIELAPAGAGTRYTNWWWESTLAGVAMTIFAGAVLVRSARALQRRATPTRVFK
jgi:hypothetical protein